MRTVHDAKRRAFLQALTTTTAALIVGACGDAVQPTSTGTASLPVNPATNLPPVWTTVPTVTFTQGVAASFSVAAFVSDPNFDPLTLTKNSVTLPAGVTFDATGKRFVYDGVGAVASAGGVVLTADDGRP